MLVVYFCLWPHIYIYIIICCCSVLFFLFFSLTLNEFNVVNHRWMICMRNIIIMNKARTFYFSSLTIPHTHSHITLHICMRLFFSLSYSPQPLYEKLDAVGRVCVCVFFLFSSGMMGMNVIREFAVEVAIGGRCVEAVSFEMRSCMCE